MGRASFLDSSRLFAAFILGNFFFFFLNSFRFYVCVLKLTLSIVSDFSLDKELPWGIFL